MIHNWLSHQVCRFKSRFDHHELSRQSTSSNNSSNSSASRNSSSSSRSSPMSIKSNRGSRRSKSCSIKKDYQFTREEIAECQDIVRKKQKSSVYEGLIEFAEPGSDVCFLCFQRVGKYKGNQCTEKHTTFCKNCAYDQVLEALDNYKTGNMTHYCIHCYVVNTGFVRMIRIPVPTIGDENDPTRGEGSTISVAECSITFQDYAEAMCRAAESKRSGRVNKGFESSSSI